MKTEMSNGLHYPNISCSNICCIVINISTRVTASVKACSRKSLMVRQTSINIHIITTHLIFNNIYFSYFLGFHNNLVHYIRYIGIGMISSGIVRIVLSKSNLGRISIRLRFILNGNKTMQIYCPCQKK